MDQSDPLLLAAVAGVRSQASERTDSATVELPEPGEVDDQRPSHLLPHTRYGLKPLEVAILSLVLGHDLIELLLQLLDVALEGSDQASDLRGYIYRGVFQSILLGRPIGDRLAPPSQEIPQEARATPPSSRSAGSWVAPWLLRSESRKLASLVRSLMNG